MNETELERAREIVQEQLSTILPDEEWRISFDMNRTMAQFDTILQERRINGKEMTFRCLLCSNSEEISSLRLEELLWDNLPFENCAILAATNLSQYLKLRSFLRRKKFESLVLMEKESVLGWLQRRLRVQSSEEQEQYNTTLAMLYDGSDPDCLHPFRQTQLEYEIFGENLYPIGFMPLLRKLPEAQKNK